MISRVTIEIQTPNDKGYPGTSEEHRADLMYNLEHILFIEYGFHFVVVDGPYTD